MRKDFEQRILEIAHSSKSVPENTLNQDEADQGYLDVIDEFFSITREAVDIYNAAKKSEALAIYKLPKEFLEMFMDIPGRRGGFCIISPYKLVIFFDEDPHMITVIGKSRNKDELKNSSSQKVTQLLKVSFYIRNGKYEYKDNTGGTIEPYDILPLMIKWVSG